MLTPLAVQSSSTQYNCVYLYIKSKDEIYVIFIINITEWQTVEKGVKFDHNLDEVPLEIKSNTAKGTPGKYVWIQGTIGLPLSGLDVFTLALKIEDNSAWLTYCNGPGETFFNPEPATTEVVWTVFKTSKEMVIECNGELCLKYTYSDSVLGDIKCTTFNQPSIQMFFVDHGGQVAEQYRASGKAEFDLDDIFKIRIRIYLSIIILRLLVAVKGQTILDFQSIPDV